MLQAVMNASTAATIPNYAVNNNNSNNNTNSSSPANGNITLPLDLLASAVSNFRPNGYTYLPPNRLAPLSSDASSPASTSPSPVNSCAEKLPSLKALAQVAFELESTSSSSRRPW